MICGISSLKAKKNQNSLLCDSSVPTSVISQDFSGVAWKRWLKRGSPKDCSFWWISGVSLNFSLWANQWQTRHPKIYSSHKLSDIFLRVTDGYWGATTHALKKMESKYSANHKLAERTVKNPVPKELMNKGKKLFEKRDRACESRGEPHLYLLSPAWRAKRSFILLQTLTCRKKETTPLWRLCFVILLKNKFHFKLSFAGVSFISQTEAGKPCGTETQLILGTFSSNI